MQPSARNLVVVARNVQHFVWRLFHGGCGPTPALKISGKSDMLALRACKAFDYSRLTLHERIPTEPWYWVFTQMRSVRVSLSLLAEG